VVLEESLGRTGALIFAMECLSKGQGFVDPAFDGPICIDPLPGELGAAPGGLTPREIQILQLVAEGLSNRSIGEQLHIATSTARDHVRDILRRLGVKSRAAAAVEGLRQGYCR
jgi:DNA-binding NarL/FixJ family response regulator